MSRTTSKRAKELELIAAAVAEQAARPPGAELSAAQRERDYELRIISFPMEDVRRLTTHARSCAEWHMPYREMYAEMAEADRRAGREPEPYPHGDPRPALQLVGDHGVYLMSNGLPGLPADGDQHVVYALGGNPRLDPDFYDFKVDMWGGDDGVDLVEIDEVDRQAATGQKFLRIQLPDPDGCGE